jgi:hypothetical protein
MQLFGGKSSFIDFGNRDIFLKTNSCADFLLNDGYVISILAIIEK